METVQLMMAQKIAPPGLTASKLAAYAGQTTSPFSDVYDTTQTPWALLTALGTPPTGSAFGVAFSPDGNYLAFAHTNSPYVSIYNTSNWSKVSNPSTLPGQNGSGVCFSPDSTLMAVASADAGASSITIYNVGAWTVAHSEFLNSAQCRDCKFSPDGTKLLVTGDGSPYVTVFTVSGWSKSSPSGANIPHGPAYVCAWSPDGTKFAVGSGNGASTPFLNIFTASSLVIATTPSTQPTAWVSGIAWSPDGTMLAVGFTASGWLIIYNTTTWATISSTPNPGGAPGNLGFSPESTILTVGAGGANAYRTDTWAALSLASATTSCTASDFQKANHLAVHAVGANFTGFTSTTTITDTITTTVPNCLIIAYPGNDQAQSGGAYQTNTISGGGLTWTKRTSVQYATGTAYYNTVDVWWAIASSAGSYTITNTISALSSGGAFNSLKLVAISGVDTTTPFDTQNVSTVTATGASGALPTASISTNNANDMLIGCISSANAGISTTPATGFTVVGTASTSGLVEQKTVTTTQSSTAVSASANATQAWVVLADAVRSS